jgi:PAS domain S-box-containing protein
MDGDQVMKPQQLHQLKIFSSYLDEILEVFYSRILSHEQMRRFFRDEAHIRAMIARQKSAFLDSLEDWSGVKEHYTRLGAVHYQHQIPYIDFIKSTDILRQAFLDIALFKLQDIQLVATIEEYFRFVDQYMCKGYIDKLVVADKEDVASLIASFEKVETAQVEEELSHLSWLYQLLLAIEKEDIKLAPQLDVEQCQAHALGTESGATPFSDKRLTDLHQRLHIDARNIFYFIDKHDYPEALSLYSSLLSAYKVTLFFLGRQSLSRALADTQEQLALQSHRMHKLEQAEQHIRELNHLNDNILDNAPVAIYVVDTDHRVLKWNKYLEKSTGINKTGILGENILEVIPSMKNSGRYEALRQALEDGVPYHVLNQKIVRSIGGHKGESRYQDVSIVPLQDEERIIGAITILSDVTTRKMAEESAQQAEREIERNRSRLNRLSRVMAMGELTTSIAHEIGQPITAIENYVQALMRRVECGVDDMGKLLELLSKINSQAQRAAEIITHTRDRVRKYDVELGKHDLNELVMESVKLTESDLALQECELHFDLSPSPLYVQVDKLLIQKVIINLLRNAIDSVAELESTTREIKLQVSESDGDMVSLKVIDSGKGIVAHSDAELFEPFYTTKDDGLGIGLAICDSIMKAHQGTICYNACSEGGAEFEITLRRA